MRAVICKEFGAVDNLVVGQVERRETGPMQLRISIHVASLGFMDILMARGLYQLKPPLPYTPGSCGAGTAVVSAFNIDCSAGSSSGTTRDGRMPASKKTQVKKPEAKADLLPDDEPMTIGNFIRFLFIAALVIALFLFIGGQALQMSKSFEK